MSHVVQPQFINACLCACMLVVGYLVTLCCKGCLLGVEGKGKKKKEMGCEITHRRSSFTFEGGSHGLDFH